MDSFSVDQEFLPVGKNKEAQAVPSEFEDVPLHGDTSPAQTSSYLPSPPTSTPVVSAGSSAPARIRRRNRMITSCLECRRRKLKCDKSHPCINCTKFRRECVFLSKEMDQASQLKLTEIKEKVGSLERLLERDIARPSVVEASQKTAMLPGDEDDDLPGQEDEKDLEPTQLAIVDAAYEEGDEADDDLLDLGIRIGRMRITERIGGFVRPKFAEEVKFTMYESPDGERSQANDHAPAPQAFFTNPDYNFMKPGSSYIAPTSGFFFGQAGSQQSLLDFLPSRVAADRLVQQYFDAVHPIARVVHRPSFERDYETFWQDLSMGLEPPSSQQIVIFAAMFSGVVSMDETSLFREFGVSKTNMLENFKTGTESALGRAHFLRTTKVATLQGFVMYLIPLCREEISRAHSVLIGAAIRMAECMGMHRDGEYYGLDPLETHIRRLIWHQLCFMDLRTCEAQGPRPQIRKEDYDTQIPGNYDDADLDHSGSIPLAADRWTDATFSMIRFEINEMYRTIWIDRPRIEQRKISLTAVLAKVETFKKNMAAKYDHLIDERIPLHCAAKVTKAALLSRLHIMILHRYHNSVTCIMPERLRKILLSACLIMCETSIMLDTHPSLMLYKWYVGAYTQYHAGMLLLVDTFFYKSHNETERIWRCLDYIFETDQNIPRVERARKVLAEIQEKAIIYAEKRKMRVPAAMQKSMFQRLQRQPEPEAPGVSNFTTPSDDLSPSALDHQPSIGKLTMPAPNAVFAAESNGETLWTRPYQQQFSAVSQSNPRGDDDHSGLSSISTGSENGSLGAATTGFQTQFWGATSAVSAPAAAPVSGRDDLMADIDWEQFDALFPPDQVIGDMGSFGIHESHS